MQKDTVNVLFSTTHHFSENIQLQPNTFKAEFDFNGVHFEIQGQNGEFKLLCSKFPLEPHQVFLLIYFDETGEPRSTSIKPSQIEKVNSAYVIDLPGNNGVIELITKDDFSRFQYEEVARNINRTAIILASKRPGKKPKLDSKMANTYCSQKRTNFKPLLSMPYFAV